MLEYAVRRVCLLIPTLFVTSVLLFFAMRTLPSQDAIELTLGPQVIHDNPGLAEWSRRARRFAILRGNLAQLEPLHDLESPAPLE